MRLICSFTLMAGLIFSQIKGTPVNVISYPTADQPATIFDYDGSNNVIYIGYAIPIQPTFSWTVSGSTLTSIVVSANVGTVTTSTAHGLAVGNPVIVAGSATTTLNATYRVASVPSPTTFTVTTSGVSNATYNDSTLTVSTSAPRTTASVWSIQCFQITSGNTTSIQWMGGSAALYKWAWTSRTTTPCQ